MFLYYLTSRLKNLRSQISRSEIISTLSEEAYFFREQCVTSDNSHYSIVKDLLLLLSTKRRNFSIQIGGLGRHFKQAGCLPSAGAIFEGSSFNYLRFDISNLRSQGHGGGEGIRTPDPRVANAVLCQLSYTPETLPIGDCRLPI